MYYTLQIILHHIPEHTSNVVLMIKEADFIGVTTIYLWKCFEDAGAMIVMMDAYLVTEKHASGSDDDGDRAMLASVDRWADM